MLRGLASSRVTPREVRSGAAAGGGRVRGKLIISNVWVLCNTGGGRRSRRSIISKAFAVRRKLNNCTSLLLLLQVGGTRHDMLH